MLNICNFAQEIISRPTQTWLSPPDSSLQLWGNKFSPTPRRGRSPLTPYPPHPLVQPTQAPLRDPVHWVQKWVIAFFTPGSAQDAAQLRFGKTCSQWESKKTRMLPPPELLHVCEEGAKLEPNCIKRDYAFQFHFEHKQHVKRGKKWAIAHCAAVCVLRAAMEAPSRSLVLCTNKMKPIAWRASPIFACSRIGPHRGCIATISSLAFI